MTQEEKNLLLKDLCARLMHGVICNCVDPNFSGSVDWTLYAINLQDDTIGATNGEWNDEFDIEEVKPYLRPMSSMTEEERIEYNIIKCSICPDEPDDYAGFVDWLNKKMFDYRGLIKMGLALEAPKGMYKEE